VQRRKITDASRDFYEAQAAWRRQLDDEWRGRILLLVRLQNRYFPLIRGTLTKMTTRLPYDPAVGKHVDAYPDTVRSFEPAAVIEELGVSADDVKEAYDHLAFRGTTADPLRSFYDLFRMAPYREREKLRGAARRSQDAYDAAEMVRRFYDDLTGEILLSPDERTDASGGEWKVRLYGHGPRVSYDRNDLLVALRLHRLDPHIVHVVVEGKSEEVLFGGLIEAISGREASTLGIGFSNLEGVGRTRLYERVLRLAKRASRFPVLVADREGDIERDVELLKAEGLLSEETVFLWNSSIEEDNFTDQELVDCASRIAKRKGGELQLAPEELRAVRESQKERLGDHGEGLAESLCRLARSPERGSVQISKPDLAAELLELLIEEIQKDGDREELFRRRPLLRIVSDIINAV
jgi:hypothetical protein